MKREGRKCRQTESKRKDKQTEKPEKREEEGTEVGEKKKMDK